MVWAALSPVTIGGSSATPPASGSGTDAGAYNAFPAAAVGSDGRVLALWTHSKGHAGSGASFVQGAVRSSTGVWGSPFTVWDESSGTVGAGVCGASFMPARGSFPARWVLIGQRLTFTNSTGSSVSSRVPVVYTSADASAWSDLSVAPFAGDWYDGDGDPLPAASWIFPSDVLWVDDGSDAGLLFAAAYAKFPGEVTGPLVVVSLDRGATWKHVNRGPCSALDRGSVPATAELVEPQLFVDPANPTVVTVFLREDTSHTMWRVDFTDITSLASPSLRWVLTAQTPVSPVIQGVSGLPVVHRDSEGGWHAFLRDVSKPRGDATHYPWTWRTSVDGVQWVDLGDFTGTSRSAMYAAVVDLPDGSMLVVHASEDGAAWGPASVYASHLVIVATSASVRYDGVPRIVVSTTIPGAVTRVHTDPDTGRVVREPVRLSAGGGTVWTDFEAPQGVPVTYETPSGVTDPVRLRDSEGVWLIHPTRPDFCTQVVQMARTEPRRYPLSFDSISVGRTDYLGRDLPVTVSSAPRGAPSGQIVVRTEDRFAYARMEALLASGCPLLVSAHRGHGGPSWVRFADVESDQVVQFCGDDRYLWTLPYVTVPRPSALDLPSNYRVRDLNVRVRDLSLTVRNGLMP